MRLVKEALVVLLSASVLYLFARLSRTCASRVSLVPSTPRKYQTGSTITPVILMQNVSLRLQGFRK